MSWKSLMPRPWFVAIFFVGAFPWGMLAVWTPPFGLNWGLMGAVAVVGLVAVIGAVYVGPKAGNSAARTAFEVIAFISFTEGAFACWYATLSAQSSEAFAPPLSKVDAVYFTISTATTTGMGDIHPVSAAARMVVTVQMVLSLFLIAAALGVALQRFLSASDK
ncbi:ion channel [Mycobacterium sp. BK086]|uniref:ion channel n=1 Tax=Mycobacterium sp. BK086 TaxID=2512165 RepID=UPI00105D6111|nr:ion channel [Mycobacterium sp. BK086]